MNNEYKKNLYVCPFCGSEETYPNTNKDTDQYGYAYDHALIYHYRYCCDCRTRYKLVYRPTRAIRLV